MHPRLPAALRKISAARACAALLAAAVLCGCAHTKSASAIAKDGGLYGKFVPAAKTTVVGKADMVSESDAIAVLELNRDPFPIGAYLVARDNSQNSTAVLQATKNARHNLQGVMIVSGQLTNSEEVVEPGPELAKLVQTNIDTYLAAHADPAKAAPPASIPTLDASPAPSSPITTTPTAQ